MITPEKMAAEQQYAERTSVREATKPGPKKRPMRINQYGVLDTHPAIRHLERKSSKTHEDPSMKPTTEMLTPTAKQDPHPQLSRQTTLRPE